VGSTRSWVTSLILWSNSFLPGDSGLGCICYSRFLTQSLPCGCKWLETHPLQWGYLWWQDPHFPVGRWFPHSRPRGPTACEDRTQPGLKEKQVKSDNLAPAFPWIGLGADFSWTQSLVYLLSYFPLFFSCFSHESIQIHISLSASRVTSLDTINGKFYS
jgi:hypothetical protein